MAKGSRSRGRDLLSAHPIQARRRSLSAASWRRRRGVGLAGSDGQRSGQGTVQTPPDLRMHPCPLTQLGPAALDRARHPESPCRCALLRTRQQHLARSSPRQRLEGQPSTQTLTTHATASPQQSAGHLRRPEDISTIRKPANPKASHALRMTVKVHASWHQVFTAPPSTAMVCPVTKSLSAEARKISAPMRSGG